LLDQIFSSLSSIPETFDLYVTTTHKIDLSKLQLKNCRNLRVYLVENRGRDILPFLSILKQIPIENYEFFLKLHTKLSPWIKDSDSNPMRMSSGNSWRDHFISSLVGDKKSVGEIIQQFEDSPRVALITAKNCLLDVSEVYGSNKVSVIKLMKRSKMYGLGAKFTFPAGSMYWAKANLVRKICEIPVTFAEFEDEKSQDDGTMAHAIERFIGVIVLHNEMINKEI
jgi:lipopolysaccharide biosynthesis protein